MVIKINYTSSDIYVSTNVSPVYVVVNYSGTNGIGTVTSVGLSMPSAFNVANSPITTSGTIAVTGSGTTAQYVRGDGSLASFPSLTGYVPYTGATGAVNLGAYDLTVNELTIGKGLNGVANNTALGKRTLFHNTTGNYNTAVGHEAGHNLTTGQYNTAIGQSAMFTATTAGQNTAIGVNALLLTTSGGSNVAVGLDTLQHITTGSSNTAIGYNAGSHITGGSTPNTTATNSVFIGRDSKAAADGQTNQIVIGQNAVGNGSNTATFGNTATTANYFTGSINGGSFVKSGGTSSQFLKADGSVDSSTYVGGSGATGQVAYWNGTNSQTGSNNLFWNNTLSNLGIGFNNINTAWRLGVAGNVAIEGFLSFGSVVGTGSNGYIQVSSTDMSIYSGSGRILSLYANANERARITTGGNLLVGGTTDGGQRLQVQGDAFVKGSGNTSATTGLQVQNSDGTNILNVRNDGAVQIGSQSTTQRPYLAGYTAYNEFSVAQTALGIVTQFGAGLRPDPGILFKNSSNFTFTSNTANYLVLLTNYSPTSGTGVLNNFVVQPTINQTGGANGITRGIHIQPTLTAAADWRSIEWSNNSGWGLYGAGTANNYLEGDTAIGTTTLGTATKLTIGGSETASSAIARGGLLNTTLVAAANNDVLVGLDINPTFTIGAFTNTTRYSARISNTNALLIAADGGRIDFVNNGGNGRLESSGGTFSMTVGSGSDGSFPLQIGHTNSSGTKGMSLAANIIRFQTGGFGSTVGQIFSTTGNWVLQNGGTFTDAGYRLDVNGTARVSGSLTVDTNTLFVDATNDRVGIGTTSPATKLEVVGASGIQIRNASTDGFSFQQANTNSWSWTALTAGSNYNIQNANVGIGTATPAASAILDVTSTSKGFLPPRMTTTQKNAIGTPAAGLMVFDTTLVKLCVYNGTNWETITSI